MDASVVRRRRNNESTSAAQNNSKRTTDNSAANTRAEMWRTIVVRYDQRIMSGNTSAYAAMISNNSERRRAKDVEQFDDILRMFINKTTNSRTDSA